MINPRTDNDHPVRTRPLLDIPGCADYIASSVRHVRRMVAERTIPHYKVGHFVRFDPDEIDEWLAAPPSTGPQRLVTRGQTALRTERGAELGGAYSVASLE